MIDCSSMRRLLHAYLDGEISATGAMEIQTHLEGCVDCAVLFRKEKLFLDLLKDSLTPAVAPVGLEQKVRAALRSSSSNTIPKKQAYTQSRFVLIPLVSLAVVLFTATLPFFQSDSTRDL